MKACILSIIYYHSNTVKTNEAMLSVDYIPMQYYDAIFIHFADDDGRVHHIILDGGEIKSPKYCYYNRLKERLEEIFNRGESIDLWVITHIDDDHIGGLYSFINDIGFFEDHQHQLNEVWMNYGGVGDYDVQRGGTIGYSGGKKLRDVLHEKGICVKDEIRAGFITSIATAEIVVIAPDSDSYNRYVAWWDKKEFGNNVITSDGLISGGDWDYEIQFKDFDLNHYEEDKDVKNNSSIAFVLTYHNYCLLFSADSCSSELMTGLENVGIVKAGKIKLDLVHIPHHGSSHNSSFEFLKSIDCPRYTITGNGENRFRLPDKETIARLIAANPNGCELHFTERNSKLEEIFVGEDDYNISICFNASYVFE